jgi:hypothetical protein
MRSVFLLSLALGTLLAADKPEKGFISLFNGKDLNGWTKSKENEETFFVKDGAIVANGKRCHLYYTGMIKGKPATEVKNFELKVDVMTLPVSNGGVYFHTAYQETGFPDKGFEVQVNNSHGDWKKTGGLYDIQDNKEPFQDNVWLTEHIIVQGKHVQIFVNGKKVSDWTQPEDFVPAKNHPQRVIATGTFALQGHDPKSTVYYKNIRVKLLK